MLEQHLDNSLVNVSSFVLHLSNFNSLKRFILDFKSVRTPNKLEEDCTFTWCHPTKLHIVFPIRHELIIFFFILNCEFSPIVMVYKI